MKSLTLLLALAAASAAAQLAPSAPMRLMEPATGTPSGPVLVIGSDAFTVPSPGLPWATMDFMKYATTGSGCCFNAAVFLPEGAALEAISVEGCDNSVTGGISLSLLGCASPAGQCYGIVSGTTGDQPLEHCTEYALPLWASYVIDNGHNSYFVQITNSGDVSGNVRFRAFRAYYRLQVGPAPQVATFDDVPTSHPFYQYVEALASAGITSGCAQNQFCPDAPVTRGQVAVFLARALGLHWAP